MVVKTVTGMVVVVVAVAVPTSGLDSSRAVDSSGIELVMSELDELEISELDELEISEMVELDKTELGELGELDSSRMDELDSTSEVTDV